MMWSRRQRQISSMWRDECLAIKFSGIEGHSERWRFVEIHGGYIVKGIVGGPSGLKISQTAWFLHVDGSHLNIAFADSHAHARV